MRYERRIVCAHCGRQLQTGAPLLRPRKGCCEKCEDFLDDADRAELRRTNAVLDRWDARKDARARS